MVNGRNGDSPCLTLDLVKEGQLQEGTSYTNRNTKRNPTHRDDKKQEETEANLIGSKCLRLQNPPPPWSHQHHSNRESQAWVTEAHSGFSAAGSCCQRLTTPIALLCKWYPATVGIGLVQPRWSPQCQVCWESLSPLGLSPHLSNGSL